LCSIGGGGGGGKKDTSDDLAVRELKNRKGGVKFIQFQYDHEEGWER